MKYKLKESIIASKLSKALDMAFNAPKDYEIRYVSQSKHADAGTLSFSTSETSDDLNSQALFICKNELNLKYKLVSNKPRLDFIKTIQYIEEGVGFINDFESNVHSSVSIGKNVVIEEGVFIDEDTHIDHNSVIMKGTRIGKSCYIGPSTTIGNEGFGYERDQNGIPIKFLHLGGVNIGNNVEIGSQNTIDRGTLSNTIIESNVKTDNQVHIGHNVHVKNGALITACAELSGGVTIGKNAWIAPNTSIIEKVTIGENSLIGIGAVVTKNVDNNVVVAGNPARQLKKK